MSIALTCCFKKNAARLVAFGILAGAAMPALAHVDASHAFGSFSAGFMHPLSGLDHLLAMLAVGLWAANNQRAALSVLPFAFPSMMVAGAAFGASYGVVPGLETAIAATVAGLGLLLAFAVRLPSSAGASAVLLVALLHGHAHGAELRYGVSALLYGAGFVATTALLHLLGWSAARAADGKMAAQLIRGAGAGIAAAGIYLLTTTV